MKRSIYIFPMLMMFIASVSQAQTNKSAAASSEWKGNADGVHLSISISNNIIAGGESKIEATIENLSTNSIVLTEYSVTSDFDVCFVNSSGERYLTSHPKPMSGSRVPIMLPPKSRKSWTIPIIIDANMKPGKYVINVSRNINVGDTWLALHSNAITVHIK